MTLYFLLAPFMEKVPPKIIKEAEGIILEAAVLAFIEELRERLEDLNKREDSELFILETVVAAFLARLREKLQSLHERRDDGECRNPTHPFCD